MRTILLLLLLSACAHDLPQPIEYQPQSLPATAFDLPPMPVPPVINGSLCRPEAIEACRIAADYLVDINTTARACYSRVEWLRGQVSVYGEAE